MNQLSNIFFLRLNKCKLNLNGLHIKGFIRIAPIFAMLSLLGCKSLNVLEFENKNTNVNSINIAGKWFVQLDSLADGIDHLSDYKEKIRLPGSLAENGIGKRFKGTDSNRLTPAYKYVGIAYYTKEIFIPKHWENKRLTLFLERVLWESTVFVDGVEKNSQDALGTPHIHDLGMLNYGKHLLTVRVNNKMIHNIGDKGHSYTEHMQTIWNGIVGKIELMSHEDISVKKVNVFDDLDTDVITVKPEVNGSLENIEIAFKITNIKSDKTLVSMSGKPFQNSYSIPLNKKLKPWSEFEPNLYKLHTFLLKNGNIIAKEETTFGIRKIISKDNRIYVNNKPTFFRGNIDNVHFPLTGYPSCNVEDWERIFQKYKDYGLNHVRFHSWCPPEAAFIAADKLGIYIQAEAAAWIDSWMPNTIGVGKDPIRDRFFYAELNRIVETYGNHPSFVMCSIGNELGSADFNVLDSWIETLKKKDARRLYTVSTARTITPNCDYIATHYIEGLGLVRGTIQPSTNWDYEYVYGSSKLPTIAHEIGQWPIYPDWKELKKYKGVLKPRNLEGFRVQALKNGIESQSSDFQKASGALSMLMYKYEIESFLRTPSCAGIQLLGMYDYSGQGEALIGWLDAFGDSKNIITPNEFRKYSNATVPLARFDKYVWTNDEILTINAEIAHYGEQDLINKTFVFQIIDGKGKILFSEKKSKVNIINGKVTNVSAFRFPLSTVKKASRLIVKIGIEDSGIENNWSIWVFPKVVPTQPENSVVEAKSWENSVIDALNKGKSVLLNASSLGTEKSSVNFNFYPIYWSLTYFPGQDKTSIGMLVDSKSNVFNHFPTDFHSDWQWESISLNSKAFVLNKLPSEYKPLVQSVDDFHRNNKMGLLFELKVGKGKLIISGFDINQNLPVAKQLKLSLLKYMNSSHFSPEQEVSIDWLSQLLSDSNSKEIKNNQSNSIININASANIKDHQKYSWEKKNDKSFLVPQSDYSVEAEFQTCDGWSGNSININIDCPSGILGTIYIKVKDVGSLTKVVFEGRNDTYLNSSDGRMLQYHIMREDSQDGLLKLKLQGKVTVEKVTVVRK